MNIGEKIKENRLKKEWTQEQLAALLNVSRSAVSSWEVGRNYPDLTTIVAISDLFGISLDNLLREDPEMTKKVSKKIKMNKYYKIILLVIGVLILAYGGFNLKLRADESKYRSNLAYYGWSIDENSTLSAGNAYELVESETVYYVSLMPAGWIGVPLTEQNINVITRKDHLVINVNDENSIEIVIAKSNDPKVEYSGKVIVDKDLNELALDAKDSAAKADYFKTYIKENKNAYQEMINNTLAKRQEIITKR